MTLEDAKTWSDRFYRGRYESRFDLENEQDSYEYLNVIRRTVDKNTMQVMSKKYKVKNEMPEEVRKSVGLNCGHMSKLVGCSMYNELMRKGKVENRNLIKGFDRNNPPEGYVEPYRGPPGHNNGKNEFSRYGWP